MDKHGSSRRSHAGISQRGRVAGVGIGALLLAMLALSGVAPALASAEVGWQMNSSPLTEKTATTWKGTITLSTKALGTRSLLNAPTPLKGSPASTARAK